MTLNVLAMIRNCYGLGAGAILWSAGATSPTDAVVFSMSQQKPPVTGGFPRVPA